MSFKPEISDKLEPIIRLIAKDRLRGLYELTNMAQAGDKSAILYLGLYLSEDTVTNDEAVKWLIIADKFESADAAWNLAMIARERGHVKEMRRWIDRAADLGEDDAIAIRANGYDVSSVILE